MVELTYLAIIGIGLAAMFFGYAFGLFEGRGQGYKKRTKEEQKEKEGQPPPSPQTVTETVPVTVDDPGLLRIKNEGGAYALDLDGARVNPSTLLPEQRKRLIEILNAIRPWLEGKSAPASLSAPSVTTSSPPSPLLDRIQDRSAQLASSPPPAPAPPSTLLDRLQAVSAPAQPTPPPPPAQSKPAASKPPAAGKEDRPAAPTSIVAQIDAILQAHLAGTPLEERGIFLSESPQGGVMVLVGKTIYNAVDEVPDPEVKAAIRAAITEWENKYTPGL